MNFMKGLGLRELNGEFLQHTLTYFDDEFLQHTLSNFDGRLR